MSFLAFCLIFSLLEAMMPVCATRFLPFLLARIVKPKKPVSWWRPLFLTEVLNTLITEVDTVWKWGKCEITGQYLYVYNVHCHHYIPKYLGESDQFHNLRILQEDVHRLIHLKDNERIDLCLHRLGINQAILKKINQYRRYVNWIVLIHPVSKSNKELII